MGAFLCRTSANGARFSQQHKNVGSAGDWQTTEAFQVKIRQENFDNALSRSLTSLATMPEQPSNQHPKVFVAVLNLARATSRRKLMEAEAAKAGLTLEFTPCFDWTEHSEAVFDTHCARTSAWGDFYQGHRATTISHSWAWKAFLASDAEYALILEDDVYISPEVREWVRDLSWWPNGADVVKFERWDDPRVVVLLDEAESRFLQRRICRMRTRHMGAAGYMLSRAAATRLQAIQPLPMVIDHLLFNVNYSTFARTAKLYQVSPALVQQGNEPPERPFYQSPTPKPSATWARWRQKLTRGLLELNLPMSTWWSLLSRKGQLEPIEFVVRASETTPKPEP